MAFATPKDAKAASWFSRRHRTSEARDKARKAFNAKRALKVAAAKKRKEEAAKRTPQEQLRRLDERLGVGVGATRERARLNARLSLKDHGGSFY